jgi:hypothetical protein
VRDAAPGGPKARLTAPKGLLPAARAVWIREASRVPGGLRVADLTTFTNMVRVQALAERWLAEAEAVETGPKIPQSLWAAVKLSKLVAELRRPFGLSPTDRQRLHVEPEPPEEDDLARFRRENPRD